MSICENYGASRLTRRPREWLPTSMSNTEHALSAKHLQASVARMFYIDGMAKSDIATMLGISRFRVARLLDEAVATGLVQITIAEDPDVDISIGRALEERF